MMQMLISQLVLELQIANISCANGKIAAADANINAPDIVNDAEPWSVANKLLVCKTKHITRFSQISKILW